MEIEWRIPPMMRGQFVPPLALVGAGCGGGGVVENGRLRRALCRESILSIVDSECECERGNSVRVYMHYV